MSEQNNIIDARLRFETKRVRVNGRALIQSVIAEMELYPGNPIALAVINGFKSFLEHALVVDLMGGVICKVVSGKNRTVVQLATVVRDRTQPQVFLKLDSQLDFSQAYAEPEISVLHDLGNYIISFPSVTADLSFCALGMIEYLGQFPDTKYRTNLARAIAEKTPLVIQCSSVAQGFTAELWFDFQVLVDDHSHAVQLQGE